jgi:ribosomal protein S18 acetylase RimI-like enzyme
MISISEASLKDSDQLKNFFTHYKIKDYIEKRVGSYLSCNHTIIAKDNEKIVGTIQWLVKEDPNLGVAEIEEVNVIFNYQKQGIGSKMMEFTISSVKKYFQENNLKLRKIYLFVSESNLITQKFYEKFGFKKETKINNLFSNNENELFYVLDLNE